MKEKHVLTSLVIVGTGFLVAGFVFDGLSPEGPVSLADRCALLGGEWLYQSEDRICTMPDGEWLTYSETENAFVPRDSELVPEVLAAATMSCDKPPVFSDYVSAESFAGQPTVDFSTNEAARHYRTAIGKDVARGVNFAGKYVVSTWGCGEGCQGSAVVNADTGKILSYGVQSTGYDFEVDSRLLVVGKDDYYLVENDVLNQVCN